MDRSPISILDVWCRNYSETLQLYFFHGTLIFGSLARVELEDDVVKLRENLDVKEEDWFMAVNLRNSASLQIRRWQFVFVENYPPEYLGHSVMSGLSSDCRGICDYPHNQFLSHVCSGFVTSSLLLCFKATPS